MRSVRSGVRIPSGPLLYGNMNGFYSYNGVKLAKKDIIKMGDVVAMLIRGVYDGPQGAGGLDQNHKTNTLEVATVYVKVAPDGNTFRAYLSNRLERIHGFFQIFFYRHVKWY